MMGSVFAMQGIGQFTAAIIALIVTTGFKGSLETAKTVAECDGVCQLAVDKMWRVIIGFGAVPGCVALYFRLTIPETPRYTFDVARDLEQAVEDVKAYKAGAREGHPDEVSRAAVLQDSRARLQSPKVSSSSLPSPNSLLTHPRHRGPISGDITRSGSTARFSSARRALGSSSMSPSTAWVSTTRSFSVPLAMPAAAMCTTSSATLLSAT